MTRTAEATSETSRADAAESSLLSIRDLAVSFDNGNGPRIQAVDGVSLTIYPNQTVALVGESGCGKSVSAMSVLQLLPTPPARFDHGRIEFNGRDLLSLSDRDLRRIRGGQIAMIFQEPMTSLNPVFTIGEQIVEAIRLHRRVGRREARTIAEQALIEVGIRDARRRLDAYPHEFSGGMRQRVMIAMALVCEPSLLLADEPTTALDVTIQAQILDLLRDLQRRRRMSVLLITHDLGVVAENADVVCVMYGGRIVECASVERIFRAPLHPYTRGLFASIPRMRGDSTRLRTIAEVVEDPKSFTPIEIEGEPHQPWWPWRDPPPAMVPGEPPAADSVLVEASQDHWVGLWRTPESASLPRRPPALQHRTPRSDSPGPASQD